MEERYSLPEPLASRRAKRQLDWYAIQERINSLARLDTRRTCEGLNRMGDEVANIWPEAS